MWWHLPNDDVLYMMQKDLGLRHGGRDFKATRCTARPVHNPDPDECEASTVLAVCNANLLIIDIVRTYESEVTSFKIDLESLDVLEVAKGPRVGLNVELLLARPVIDGNCITFWEKNPGGRLLEYDTVADNGVCSLVLLL
ncbi:unnamed protein product [Calypogeia fissa]